MANPSTQGSDKQAGVSSSPNMWGCEKCGADLKMAPGTRSLKCDYCGHSNEIPASDVKIIEKDLLSALETQSQAQGSIQMSLVKCTGCGAECDLGSSQQSRNCPYCDTPLVLDHPTSTQVLKPESLLPFKLNSQSANEAFRKWIDSLWFAPSTLKKSSLSQTHLQAVYLPYWTFDSQYESDYWGQKGTYYTVQEDVVVNGKRQSRSVRKVRWTSASGHLKGEFDDVLVAASKSMPENFLDALEPWDLKELTPYDAKFLGGFVTERSQTDLKQSFSRAKEKMDQRIIQKAKENIGGDLQRVNSVDTDYKNMKFKHILLPTYLCSFRHSGKPFRFVVNARTGEVHGERPWSWIKIAGAVLAVLALFAAMAFFSNSAQAQESDSPVCKFGFPKKPSSAEDCEKAMAAATDCVSDPDLQSLSSSYNSCFKSLMNQELDKRLMSLKKSDKAQFRKEMKTQGHFNKTIQVLCGLAYGCPGTVARLNGLGCEGALLKYRYNQAKDFNAKKLVVPESSSGVGDLWPPGALGFADGLCQSLSHLNKTKVDLKCAAGVLATLSKIPEVPVPGSNPCGGEDEGDN